MNKVLWVILTHQASSKVDQMVEYWRRCVGEHILIVYGGAPEHFTQIKWSQKCMVDDPWLMTKDHQRERQSYCGVFTAVKKQVCESEYSHVFFTEYDQIPLRADLEKQLVREIQDRDVDVLFYGLKRIDGTSSAHWLHEMHLGNLMPRIEEISVRSQKDKVLSAYGFGQFWRSEVFFEVASHEDPPRVYLELWIPTLAYHLGYKVACHSGSAEFNRSSGSLQGTIETWKAQGELLVHPIKDYWE